jgi:hypothetical protein
LLVISAQQFLIVIEAEEKAIVAPSIADLMALRQRARVTLKQINAEQLGAQWLFLNGQA